MNLLSAHRQWAKRPADDRYQTINALHAAVLARRKDSHQKEVNWDTVRVENVDGDVQMVGKGSVPARLTHFAFGQVCRTVGAPAQYLRELPATLASQNLNYGLAKHEGNPVANMLFHINGSPIIRAVTTDAYARIWDAEITERLVGLQDFGWEPAVPDKTWSEDQENVTALYASDHDMFAFLRLKNIVIAEPGTDQPIYRGIIVSNSEVGAASLTFTRFMYRYMCGNHIIWGAENVAEISLRHVGSIRDRFSTFSAKLRVYADSSVSDEEAKIKHAKSVLIAATKEEVLDTLFGKRALRIPLKVLNAAYDACQPDNDGDPRTPWGMAQGLTRHSQTLPYADERTELDKAAGRVLDAF
jgi:hypothetical protein